MKLSTFYVLVVLIFVHFISVFTCDHKIIALLMLAFKYTLHRSIDLLI